MVSNTGEIVEEGSHMVFQPEGDETGVGIVASHSLGVGGRAA